MLSSVVRSYFRQKFVTSRPLSAAAAAQLTPIAVPQWANFSPGGSSAHVMKNLVGGSWTTTKEVMGVVNPMDASSGDIVVQPKTAVDELDPFVSSLASCSKTGLHNPLRNVDRYLMLGDVSRKAGEYLKSPEGEDYFAKCIVACMPKSFAQARGEVRVTADFLCNFSGDNVRMLAEGFSVPGDHDGQESRGYRFPYGPCMLISPFNFPLEIPVLQLMGGLFMGNKILLKPSEKVGVVMEQFLRLLHDCGLPKTDVDLLNCEGPVASALLDLAPVRLTQFTGSTTVADIISKQTLGKVKIEDAGFDWKILGPDVGDVEYVAWQSDQDAYACSGQKCSAQSILFVHENWEKEGILDKIKDLAEQRTLDDLTVGPVLTHTTEDILGHTNKLLQIPGSELVIGGKELEGHNIPSCYGAVSPTAVKVPIKEISEDSNFPLVTKEVFGPFQVVSTYKTSEIPLLLSLLERMSHHLTAACVSNDVQFQNLVLSCTVNGTTYCGRRARTTGAPQNHFFGPSGDPRGAGIGSKEAIRNVWSSHREIIHDAMVPTSWKSPGRS